MRWDRGGNCSPQSSRNGVCSDRHPICKSLMLRTGLQRFRKLLPRVRIRVFIQNKEINSENSKEKVIRTNLPLLFSLLFPVFFFSFRINSSSWRQSPQRWYHTNPHPLLPSPILFRHTLNLARRQLTSSLCNPAHPPNTPPWTPTSSP